jgi:hypothetical protein
MHATESKEPFIRVNLPPGRSKADAVLRRPVLARRARDRRPLEVVGHERGMIRPEEDETASGTTAQPPASISAGQENLPPETFPGRNTGNHYTKSTEDSQ